MDHSSISAYVSSVPSLVGYVREQLVHAVAVMVKRATLEVDKSKLFDSVFATVSQLLAMDAKMVYLDSLGPRLPSFFLFDKAGKPGNEAITISRFVNAQ